MLTNYVNEYEADGLLINSIKSCNSFSAGQLLIMREVEKRTGKPAAFVETDLVDPRYFSAANVKNRLESYFQMVDQKRSRRRRKERRHEDLHRYRPGLDHHQGGPVGRERRGAWDAASPIPAPTTTPPAGSPTQEAMIDTRF